MCLTDYIKFVDFFLENQQNLDSCYAIRCLNELKVHVAEMKLHAINCEKSTVNWAIISALNIQATQEWIIHFGDA